MSWTWRIQLKAWAPELRRWLCPPIEHLFDMCRSLGSIPILNKEDKRMDYVRKGRRQEMKEEKVHRSWRKKCSEHLRGRKRGQRVRKIEQAALASGDRGSLITGTLNLP